MRVFFALELDAHTTMAIANWRDRNIACPGRPVPPGNFHITLSFVGPIDNRTLDRLCLGVDEWLLGQAAPAGALQLDRVGYWQKAGIYWLGASSCPEQLSAMAMKLASISVSHGARRDSKPFQPHVTLYRGCSGAPAAPSQMACIPYSYRHFTLMESIQGKRGVSYQALQSWELGTVTS